MLITLYFSSRKIEFSVSSSINLTYCLFFPLEIRLIFQRFRETAPYNVAFSDSFMVVKICILFMEMAVSYSFLLYPNTVCALYNTLFQ